MFLNKGNNVTVRTGTGTKTFFEKLGADRNQWVLPGLDPFSQCGSGSWGTEGAPKNVAAKMRILKRSSDGTLSLTFRYQSMSSKSFRIRESGSCPVFRIRDILTWIRIRGSVHTSNLRIQIRILLFLSVTFKKPQNKIYGSGSGTLILP
jgi:hypothetical protein